MWLEDVIIPRHRVFTGEPINRNTRHSLVSWLLWHHSYGWLAKAELTLSIALALAEVMGLKENPQTTEQLVELTVNVQTTRTCMVAAELEPETTAGGHALPNQLHVAAAGINTLRVRQRMSEILRALPGSSLVNAPADTDFADPTMAAELEDAFGGGGYTAMQRAALLHWRGTRCRQAWTVGRRCSKCMPAAAWPRGSAGWRPVLKVHRTGQRGTQLRAGGASAPGSVQPDGTAGPAAPNAPGGAQGVRDGADKKLTQNPFPFPVKGKGKGFLTRLRKRPGNHPGLPVREMPGSVE